MQTDELHYAILNELQLDARMSNAEIGRRVGLSAPAVAERIRRMQEEGIIKGFFTSIEFSKLNYLQKVLIAVKLPPVQVNVFLKEVEKIEGITNVIHTTGEYCFFVSMILKSTAELNIALHRFGKLGATTTFSVLSIPIELKSIHLPTKRITSE